MGISKANVANLAEEEAVKRELLRVAEEFQCRLLHERGDWHFQSLEITGFEGGGHRTVTDKSRWLQLGKFQGREA
eukprot:1523657-Karenia_brevis.AAC.1